MSLSSPVSRRRFFGLAGAAGATLAAGRLFAGRASACPAVNIPDEREALANGINQFAANLHAWLARDKKDSLFFSPFSIEAALAMTAAGARGDTLKEMQNALHLPPEPHRAFGELIDRLNGTGSFLTRCRRNYELSVANAIWAQKGYPWEKDFLALTRKHYGAGTVQVDFDESEAARKRINAWVETETRDKVKDLIAPGVITGLTRMVLANAIYFKGNWQAKFDKKLTKEAAFTRADGTTTGVPLMSQKGRFNYGVLDLPTRKSERVQVLELPYAGGDLSMLVYLPDSANAINALTGWLSGDALGRPELAPQSLDVYLPRFKAESSFQLKPALMELGMKKAFGDADFTGMSPEGKNLYISHVLHKALVDVNEEGSEAAAATAVVIKARVSAPVPVVFRADRPFVFSIRENKTRATLFLGRYTGV